MFNSEVVASLLIALGRFVYRLRSILSPFQRAFSVLYFCPNPVCMRASTIEIGRQTSSVQSQQSDPHTISIGKPMQNAKVSVAATQLSFICWHRISHRIVLMSLRSVCVSCARSALGFILFHRIYRKRILFGLVWSRLAFAKLFSFQLGVVFRLSLPFVFWNWTIHKQ